MSMMTWLRRLLKGTGTRNARAEARPSRSRWQRCRPWLEMLEGRLAPATNITIIASGVGTLDHFLSASNGTITTADDPGDTAATLSVGALQGVGPGVTVSIAADATIHFNDIGSLTLQTGTGFHASFMTTTGAIDFANVGNTVSTGGGSLTFSAGTNLTVANLNTNGGDVSLVAGTTGTGSLQFENILTSGSGNLSFQAGSTAGTITQTGSASTASGQAISATAVGAISVNSLRGTTVSLTSFSGSVTSAGASPIQGSAQVTLSAATGINVFILTPSIRATNTTSGNIIITQLPPPSQDLIVVGSGVVNQAAGGIVSLTNSAGDLTVTGSTVQTNNGSIFLSGTGLDLAGGTVNSGTAATELHNGLAGLAFDIGHKVLGKIGLTQADLDAVTASLLRIGTNSVSSINVSAAIHGDASWNNTLALIANGPITEVAAGSLTLANLRVTGAGPVTLLSVNNVQNLSASVGGAGNAFTINNGTNTLTIAGGTGVDGVVGVTTNTGNITLIADNIVIHQVLTPGPATDTTNTVLLEPFTTSLNITVGTASVPGTTFGITNGGLGWITSGVTQIGFFADLGTITITNTINRTPNPLQSAPQSRSQILALVTGNLTGKAVTQTATLSVANLAVEAAGSVTLTNAGNAVDKVAAAITGSNAVNQFDFTDSTGFSVSTVAGVVGITIATGTIEAVVLNAGGSVTQDAGANITSQNLLLLGTGGYSLTNSGNDVTTLAANVTNSVSYTDANDLTIGAVTDEVTVTTIFGVTTDGADANITASAVTSGTTLTVSNAIDTTSTANITLTADQMSLGASVNAHAGIVTLEPTTAGRAVTLGTTVSGTLSLLQTDLNNVTAGVLRIGNLNTTGSITVTAPITDAGLGWNTLSLLTEVGAGISQNSGATLTVTNLNAAGNTGVTLNQNNVVSNLAGATQSGAFSFTDHTNLTVDNVDSGLGNGFGSGIITQAQVVNLTVNILNDSLTINQTIDTTHSFGPPAGGGAKVNLSADNMALNNNAPSSTIDAGTSGVLTLTPFTPSHTISVGGADAAGTLGIDDNDLSNVTANIVRIGSGTQTGAVTVGGTITTHAGYNTLELTAAGSGGAVTQTTGSIQVANLVLVAYAGIGSAGGAGAIQVVSPTSTSPINVGFANSTSNNVAITETGSGGMTIKSIEGLPTATNSAAGGTVTLLASSPMTFAVNTTSSGTISATTTETGSENVTPLPPPDDDLTVNSGVTLQSTGGDVDLTSGDSIIEQPGSVLKANGTVNTTVGMGDNDNDAFFEAPVVLTIDATGTITVDQNVTVTDGVGGPVRTVGQSITSGTADVLDIGSGNFRATSVTILNQSSDNLILHKIITAQSGDVSVTDTNGTDSVMTLTDTIDTTAATSGMVAVAAVGQLVVNSGATISSTGNVSLTDAGNTAGDGISDAANITAAASGATITLGANRDVSLTGTTTLSTTSATGGAISVTAAENVPGSTTGGTGAVTMGSGTSIDTSANNSTITVDAGTTAGQGGDITVGLLKAGTGAVNVKSFAGSIVDGNGSGTLNVTGGALNLSAGGASGINLDVATVTPATAGVTATSTGGNIALRSTQQLQVDNVSAGTANDVSLTVTNANTATSSITSLHPNNNVADVTGRTVTLTANGASTGNTGQIGFFTTGAQFFEVAATTLNASTNNSRLWISAIGGTAVGSINAGTNTAFLRTFNGDLTSTHTGSTPDVTAASVNLSSPGTTGSFGTALKPLLVQTGTLKAAVTGTGSINVTNVAAGGNLAVTGASTANGAINLAVAGGDLTTTATTGTDVSAPGNTVTLSASGAIVSGTGAGVTDVGASNLVLTAATGIGSAAALKTAVTNLEFQNSASGAVQVTNSGALTITAGDGITPSFNDGGSVTLAAASPLTFAVNTTSQGDLTATAADSATGDNVTVISGNTVKSTTGNLLLRGGEAVSVPAGATVQAAGTITLIGGFGDGDGDGGSVSLLGTAAGSAVNVSGGAGPNTYTVAPQVGAPVTVTGTAGAGDTFNFEALELPVFTSFPGRYTAAGLQPVAFSNVPVVHVNDAAAVTTFYGPDTSDRSSALAGLTPNERFVQVLYLDALGRAGSKAELDGWVGLLTGPGGSQALVAGDIERSAEARQHLVVGWYQAYLGRTPQNGEQQGWVNMLLAGQTEQKVLGVFLSTPEFYNRAPVITGDGGPASDTELVKALYVVLLDRTGTSSEVAGWVGGLPALGRSGVVAAILQSQEFRTDLVEATYNVLLHRPSDSAGLQMWVNADLDATSLRVGFESTSEFFTNG